MTRFSWISGISALALVLMVVLLGGQAVAQPVPTAVDRWKITGADDTSDLGLHDVNNGGNGLHNGTVEDGGSYTNSTCPRGGSSCKVLDLTTNGGYGWSDTEAADLFESTGEEPNDGYDAYTGSRTFAAWVKIPTIAESNGDHLVFFLGRDAGYLYGYNTCRAEYSQTCRGFNLAVQNTTGAVIFGNAQGGSITCGDVSDGGWHHLVGVYSSEAQELELENNTWIYIDGELCGAGAIPVPYTDVGEAARWAIGGRVGTSSAVAGDSRLRGYVDDVRVWNRVLSGAAVSTLYNDSNNGGAD